MPSFRTSLRSWLSRLSGRRRLILVYGIAGFLILIGALFFLPFWRITSQFDDISYRQPSRLYGQPLRLKSGGLLSREALIAALVGEGYREDAGRITLPPGRFSQSDGRISLHLRSFQRADGEKGGGLVEIELARGRVASLSLDRRPVAELDLEPPLIASYYGPDFRERRPVRLADVSKDLISAVMAAEDAAFFRHSGVSPTGIARAAWVNAKGGGLRQGGSTLTQQLVKNLYLTQERTLTRKAQEVVLSLLLELRYSKEEILEAYLNEIYLGASNGVNLLGVGAASRAFFGKEASQLDLAESATLAGIISSPATYSPMQHPERCRERRNWVLERMQKLNLSDPPRLERALAQELVLAPEPLVRRRAPYFADAMAAEVDRRFGISDLADGGYTLFSTLRWTDQQAAQQAVETSLPKIEKANGKSTASSPLQVALVSVEPRTGGILAYVGGRSYRKSQFDRVGQARRQTGSAFKPIVYAAAFERRKANPASFIEDAPLTVQLAGQPWSPKNDDGTFHGWVTVRSALEHSYNPATARLALQVGMDHVVELAHDMGITSPLDPFPAMALGAAEVTPVELASVYATLAGGGIRPSLHGIAAIRDRFGKTVAGVPLPAPQQVLSPQATYLVTSLLQGVIDRGTGRSARALGVSGELAGKTGTTNKRRDSWFAGYSPNRATVVWVGFDDNSPTRLSGAKAALPVWSRFTAAVRPPGGYPAFRFPAGLVTAAIDPENGKLATEFCPWVLTEIFRPGEVPQESCDKHQSWYPEELLSGQEGVTEMGGEDGGESLDAPAASEEEGARDHRVRRWWRRLFRSEPRPDPRPAPPPPAEEAPPPR